MRCSRGRTEAARAQSENGAVVTATELTRRYGEGDTAVDALRGVSLEVAPAQLTAIMGPSGSGKSTLMHILAALDLPTSGYVTLAGTRLGNLSDTEITKLRRKHIGFIFQFFNLLPMLTAEENILLPLSIAGTKPDKDEFEELLGRSGSRTGANTGRRSSRAASSSASPIARALVAKPTVVFADEPTGNLDSKTSGEILELLHEAVESYGQTMVMVTHDARAATIADRVLFLADGLIVQDLGARRRGADPRDGQGSHADVIRRRAPRSRGAEAPRRADGDRDRARRRDGRAARSCSPTRSTTRSRTSSASPTPGRTRSISGKSPDIKFDGDTSRDALGPDVGPRPGAEAAERRGGRRERRRSDGRQDPRLEGQGSRRTARPRSGSASTSPRPASTRCA